MRDLAHKGRMMYTRAQSRRYLNLVEENTRHTLSGWSSCVHFPYLNVTL